MTLRIIGSQPLERDEQGLLKSRIATLFLRGPALVTLPGIHAFQRMWYIESLNADRALAGQPPLTEDEQAEIHRDAVDLIMEARTILIRPDPDAMALAFQADELLQEIVSKARIRFLHVRNEAIRQALRARGECWRMSAMPRSPAELNAMINAARMSIGGATVYYYNKLAGTRWLTCGEFAALDALPAGRLRAQIREIQEYAARRNRIGHPEVAFFLGAPAFGAADVAGLDLVMLDDAALRAAYRELRDKFCLAVPAEFREDGVDNLAWRNRMAAILLTRGDETVDEELLHGLSREFYMQIEWLPGGRIEDGELMFDPVFDELDRNPGDRELQALCDTRTKGFIFNYIREFGDIEHVNIGRVSNMMTQHLDAPGRRNNYLAEVKRRGAEKPTVRIARMQKWGIHEHLEENKDLLAAILETEEYTDYVLDRRLGCRQLGMSLPSRLITQRITERYHGSRQDCLGRMLWMTYFERDYIDGIASDKIPLTRFRDARFALPLAALLGEAAAANLIVGRMDADENVLFDRGDEIVVLDRYDLPAEIVVSDQTGTFINFRAPLEQSAAAYAQPVNRRAAFTPDPRAFAEAYLGALRARLEKTQAEYRKRRRAFDSLFKHRRRDEQGSFSYRWEKVLERLDHADAAALAERIRGQMVVR